MTDFNPAYFRAQGWWRDETLCDWLDRCVSAAPDRIALLCADRTLTYAAVAADVARLAAGLADVGIGRGDVVVVHLPNLPEFLIAWLAISEIGAVMQTVHTPYGPRELEHLITHGGGKAAIALAKTKDRSPAAEIAALCDRIATLRCVVSVGGDVPGTLSFATLLERGRGKPTSLRPNADDPFLLLYTSGTTSSPKAVSVSFNHYLSNARLCAAEFGLRPDDRILCLAPYTHLYGLYAFELGLAVGATACLLDAFTPAAFIKTLKQTRPTVLIAGPAHIAPCLQQKLFADVDLSAMRFAVLSGSTVPASMSAAFEDMLPNGRVVQAWGMTELQFGACSRPTDTRAVRFETIGRATPGTELRVADGEDRVLPPGEIGELHARGCSLFAGYLRNTEASSAAFTADGWFRTGDLASMDAHGNVLLRGRSKELINRGGVKFNPIDMEIAIGGHPAVAQVAIAPVPDDALGESASCFVVLKDGASLSFEELTAFLAEQKFAKFTWPEQLTIVPEMPVTPTRKVIKAQLVSKYLGDPSTEQREGY
ncbi:MAG TPA: class I adenylate-forming enzyme family protein [Bradyrhizobium sp.]|nr:class I adenylate-forming enzyme family protein [Bradyrhizobium sp.]